MKRKLTVRRAHKSDIHALVKHNIALAAETEELHLDEKIVISGVEAVLNDPRKGIYLIAESDGEIAGQLMITNEWSDWRNGCFWWIQSVYVRPQFRKLGVYRALYQFVKELAQQETSVCGIRLYVDKNNTTAQKAYFNLGMNESHYLLFEDNLDGT
ncbi:MAG: GNAT family N-acetyltransferase [FCB group bacterium]|nr:GNAT family N-acetyltransferase [FCB group bacterium]